MLDGWKHRVVRKTTIDFFCFSGLGTTGQDFTICLGGGNSNIFYFHPYLGKIPILTNIFQMG